MVVSMSENQALPNHQGPNHTQVKISAVPEILQKSGPEKKHLPTFGHFIFVSLTQHSALQAPNEPVMLNSKQWSGCLFGVSSLVEIEENTDFTTIQFTDIPSTIFALDLHSSIR